MSIEHEMNFEQMLEIGAVREDVAVTTVNWDKPNTRYEEQEDGSTERVVDEPTRYKFKVHILLQPSYGTTERIIRAATSQAVSIGAVIVSELVRFGDKGEEKIDYSTANQMEPSLIMALRQAVDKYHNGFGGSSQGKGGSRGKEGGKKKKPH